MKDLPAKNSGSVTDALDRLLQPLNAPCSTGYQEEVKTELLLKESPTVIFILNFHTRGYVSVSDNVIDLMGIHSHEISSKDIGWAVSFIVEEQRAVYMEEMLPLAFEWFKELQQQGKDITRARLTYKLNIITREGKHLSTLHVLRPLTHDEAGLPMLAVKYVTDITPSQEVEDPTMKLDYKDGDRPFERIYHKTFSRKTETALSIRENEIVRMIQNGYSSKRIADELCISIHTVNNHRKNIIKKYNITNLHGYQLIEKKQE